MRAGMARIIRLFVHGVKIPDAIPSRPSKNTHRHPRLEIIGSPTVGPAPARQQRYPLHLGQGSANSVHSDR